MTAPAPIVPLFSVRVPAVGDVDQGGGRNGDAAERIASIGRNISPPAEALNVPPLDPSPHRVQPAPRCQTQGSVPWSSNSQPWHFQNLPQRAGAERCDRPEVRREGTPPMATPVRSSPQSVRRWLPSQVCPFAYGAAAMPLMIPPALLMTNSANSSASPPPRNHVVDIGQRETAAADDDQIVATGHRHRTTTGERHAARPNAVVDPNAAQKIDATGIVERRGVQRQRRAVFDIDCPGIEGHRESVALTTTSRVPPAETTAVPPLKTVGSTAVPPLRMISLPPEIWAPRSVPSALTVSLPPLKIVVGSATPPEDTTSAPPLDTYCWRYPNDLGAAAPRPSRRRLCGSLPRCQCRQTPQLSCHRR